MKQGTKAENGKKSLNLFALVTIGVGTSIGAGIVSVVGQAVAATGTSAWLVIVMTCLLGIVCCAAPAFMCSMLRVSGGNYGIAAMAMGDYWAGVTGLSQIGSALNMSMFASAFGMYINALIPSISMKAAGIFGMTFFFIVNLFGMKFMSKAQNVMTIGLIGGLLLFVITGIPQMDVVGTGVFNIAAPGFFSDGIFGVLSATSLMIFSTTGMRFLVNFSNDAIRPKKDMPIAILLTCLIVTVLYSGIAVVECGVLPIDQVAGGTLSVIAAHTMPKPLYLLFMIGGPIMALSTTINSGYSISAEPLCRTAHDGFLPKWFGNRNKYGAPYVVMTISYVFAILPMVANVNFKDLLSAAMAGGSLMAAIHWFCYFKAPRKVPEAWEKRYYKISHPVYDILCFVGSAIWLILWAIAMKKLTPGLLIMTVVIYAIIFLVPYIRIKQNKVNTEGAYDITVVM